MAQWIRERRWALAAMAVGLLLRLWFVLHHPDFDGDTAIYGDLARNMLGHHVYGVTEDTIRPTLMRLPGYPLFLAAVFAVFGVGRYMPVLWVQVGVGLGTCWMLGGLARRLMGQRAGLVALWAGCVCPFTANFDAAALTECWSLFCVVAALSAMERWWATGRMRWAVAVGAACAWAVLLRPEQGLLAAACVPVMLWAGWRRSGVVRGVSVASVASLVVIAPLGVWAARNWRVFRVVQPLAPKNANDPGEFVSYGFNRWYRTWAVEYVSTTDTYWLWDGSPMDADVLPARAFDSATQRGETVAAYARYNQDQAATAETDAMFAKLAAERTAAHPLRTYLLMPLGRELDMWLRPRTEFMRLPLKWWRFSDDPKGSALCLAYAALNALYLGLGITGLWRLRGSARSPVLLAALVFVLLRSALLLTIDNSEPRYTLECFPVIWLWIGAAFRRGPSGEPPARLS